MSLLPCVFVTKQSLQASAGTTPAERACYLWLPVAYQSCRLQITTARQSIISHHIDPTTLNVVQCECEYWLWARTNHPITIPNLNNALRVEWKEISATMFQNLEKSKVGTNSILMPVVLELNVQLWMSTYILYIWPWSVPLNAITKCIIPLTNVSCLSYPIRLLSSTI